MRCKLITLFLFFGASTWTASQRNRSDIAGFVLVNPKQVHRAEIAIKHFLTRLTGPIAQPITLRLSSSDGGSLQGTISEICKIIRTNIMEFARASGLTTSVRQYERIPWNSTISEDWFTESLVQGSLLLRDLARIKEEIEFKIDHYFNLHNITLDKSKESSSRKITKSFKFLSGIDDITKFNEALFKCLMSKRDRNNPISFDLSQALANLSKGSPGNTVKSFKSGLDRAFSHFTPSNGTTTEQLYVVLCHSLVEKASHYGDCTKELRRFMDCMSSSNQDSNGVIVHTLPARTWLTAIQDISDCKISIADDITSVSCVNFNRRLPRTAARQVKYIYEKVLNRRISVRSPLHRIANELGDVLSKSKWGKQFIYDVCQYFEIYQEGRKRLNILSKSAAKDKRATMRYRKISKSLHVYKNGVLKKMILAISDFHRSTSEMQKLFIRMMGSSLKKSWRSHIKIFACLSEWMTELLELFGCTNSDDTDVDTPITTTSTSSTNMIDFDSAMTSDEVNEENNKKMMKVSAMNLKKHQMRKNIDKAFERLMWSMNNVSKIRSKNNRTTLACLANNLILAAMFMETISLISTLFCLDHKNESNFEELTEEWDSHARDRRSLFPTDFAEIDTIKADSSMILESYKEIVNIHNEENINPTPNIIPINITNHFDGLIIDYSEKNKK